MIKNFSNVLVVELVPLLVVIYAATVGNVVATSRGFSNVCDDTIKIESLAFFIGIGFNFQAVYWTMDEITIFSCFPSTVGYKSITKNSYLIAILNNCKIIPLQ